MSRDVAATERKRAQSNRFHQRAERLVARTARRHRDRQARQRPQHLDGGRLPERPPLHQPVELDPPRVDLCAAAHPHPAIQNDENDQGDEQRALRDGDDEQELTARHLPTQRLIFSRATRRLIGFTR